MELRIEFLDETNITHHSIKEEYLMPQAQVLVVVDEDENTFFYPLRTIKRYLTYN